MESLAAKEGKLESEADHSKTENAALQMRLAGGGLCMLSCRAELFKVRQNLAEAKAVFAYIFRDTSGNAAANSEELESAVEAHEVRCRVEVENLSAVGDGFRNELRIFRNQVKDLQY